MNRNNLYLSVNVQPADRIIGTVSDLDCDSVTVIRWRRPVRMKKVHFQKVHFPPVPFAFLVPAMQLRESV
jgi:hypothetical protein